MKFYILVDREPVETIGPHCADWLETIENRRVAQDVMGPVRVSTIFLGIDHNFSGEGPPVLFETMVFGGRLGGTQDRYRTWEQAVAGHKAMVTRVRRQAPGPHGMPWCP